MVKCWYYADDILISLTVETSGTQSRIQGPPGVGEESPGGHSKLSDIHALQVNMTQTDSLLYSHEIRHVCTSILFV